MDKNQQQMDAEEAEYFYKDAQKRMKCSTADKDFTGACVNAKKWATESGLMPTRGDDGQLQYTPEQGAKAACHGREDICATLQIQLPILKRLDFIEKMMMICVLALAYIAYKVS